jgi:hypothetical protein
MHDTALRLRHDLLCKDDDVAVLELDLRRDQDGEVFLRFDLRETGDGDDAELSAQDRPVNLMPACAL